MSRTERSTLGVGSGHANVLRHACIDLGNISVREGTERLVEGDGKVWSMVADHGPPDPETNGRTFVSASQRHRDALRRAAIDLGCSAQSVLERLLEGELDVLRAVRRYSKGLKQERDRKSR